MALLGGAAAVAACPRVSSAQEATPVIALINAGAADTAVRNVAAFRKGLSEAGIADSRDAAVEYHWLEGQYDRLPELLADLIRRRVAVIATPGNTPATLAAKAMTTTIPIVFGVGEDPVKRGLVVSLAHPGGNATGINFFVHELVAKRLGLLHDLVPGAARIAVLVNPANALATEATLREAEDAARTLGLQIHAVHAGTPDEIEAAFAAVVREKWHALFVGGDAFFFSRRGQFATLARRDRIPTCYGIREMAEAGGLMSYGTNVADMYRQVAVYAGSILKGARPAVLPVVQSTKFEFVINLQTAKALALDVPPMLLAQADEVIE